MLRAAKSRPDPFSRNAAAGVVAMMVFQVGVNAGMTVGLVPVTGIPLPLLSYGGSSLLVTMFGVGLTARRSDI
jgi:cell division protein FtsW (lipid II flippase)